MKKIINDLENEEIGKATTRLYRPYSNSIELQKLYKAYNGNEFSIDSDIYLIDKYIKQLKKENAELKEQLKQKDKALNKAVDELKSYQSLCHPTDTNDCKNEEEWKEWCENE